MMFALLGSLLLLLSACSSQRRPPQPMLADEKLVVHIHDDGTKLFVFTVATGGPNGESAGRGAPPGGGSRGAPPSGGNNPGSGIPKRATSRKGGDTLAKRLQEKLIATGFCREGFREFERYQGLNTEVIRGECQEAATENDWGKFGTRVSLY